MFPGIGHLPVLHHTQRKIFLFKSALAEYHSAASGSLQPEKAKSVSVPGEWVRSGRGRVL